MTALRHLVCLSAAYLLLLSAAAPARAGTYNWDGGAPDDNIAAAAVLLFVVWPREDPMNAPVFRGDGNSRTVVALEPSGELQQPPVRFRWRSVPGARSYRLEVFDDDALRVLMQSVGDTTYVAPEATRVPSNGFWQLTPIDDLGMPGARSAPFRFSVTD
jgi:hypothetical protein